MKDLNHSKSGIIVCKQSTTDPQVHQFYLLFDTEVSFFHIYAIFNITMFIHYNVKLNSCHHLVFKKSAFSRRGQQ